MKPDEKDLGPDIDLRGEFARVAKAKIKAGALRCFARNGYRGTTIRQIAKASGTTHTTFYQYFKGKTELVVELGQDTLPRLLDLATDLDRALANPGWESVRGWLESYVAMWSAYSEIF